MFLCFLMTFNVRMTCRYSVRVGSSYHLSGGQIVRIKRFIRHEQFNGTTADFDYAVLELSQSLKFTDKIQPIKLPNADDKIEDHTSCLITGWGEISF